MRKFVFIGMFFTSLLGYYTGHAQYDMISKVNKLLQKEKYEQALQSISKSLIKDSTNATAYQASALYYTTTSNYNLDSAHFHSLKAIFYFDSLEDKTTTKLAKKGVDMRYLQRYKHHIDSLAFGKAHAISSLTSYNHYIDIYQTSQLLDSTISLRNQLAFDMTLNQNTYHGYRSFMEKYPDADQVAEAKARFEKLYYDESVQDGKVTSYTKFLEDHPQSVYRALAELQILKLSTIQNRLEDYLAFINKYPSSPHVKTALNYGYHLGLDLNEARKIDQVISDSLQFIDFQSRQALFPIYNNGYGFIDKTGKVTVPITYQPIQIGATTLGGIYDHFIWKNDQLLTKMGKVFWQGKIDTLYEIGSGLLQVVLNGNHGVIHLSGKEILPPQFQDILLINSQFIAYQKDNKWALCSALGLPLVSHSFDEIIGLQQFVLLRKGDKWAITNGESIFSSHNKAFLPSFIYDDFESFDKDHLIVYDSDQSNIISSSLEEKLPTSTKSFQSIHDVLITEDKTGHHIIDRSTWSKVINTEIPILANNSGIYYENNQQWYNWNNGSNDQIIGCNTLTLLGDYFIKCQSDDSVSFTFQGGTKFHKNVKYQILQKKNENYLQVTTPESELLIDSEGRIMSIGNYSDVTILGDSLLLVEKDELKGILDTKGDLILETKYDAIQRSDSANITLLNNGKFGIFNSFDLSTIDAIYDQKFKTYNAKYYKTRLDGLAGLISHNNDIIISHDYDVIHYWNDSSAVLKKDYEWLIYDIINDTTLVDNINQFTILNPTSSTKLFRIFKDNGFGLLHSERGMIIPPTFSSVKRLENNDTELFIAEKYIEEADFYVIVYYNIEGQAIYKHAMEAKNYRSIE